MPSSKNSPRPATSTERPDSRPDPVDDALPIDEVDGTAIQPTDPDVVTELDDDEGGADAIDPDTGRPYENSDPGTKTPAATRIGGTEQQ